MKGEEIVCTGGHPFYVVGLDKFIPAKELKLYEKVLLSDGSYGIIDSIGIEALLKPEVTYNFEVADYHTYYVGECNVLVHNKCVEPVGPRNPDTGIPNSTKIRWANNGKIYSATTYDEFGREIARLDFYGEGHFIRGIGKTIPHVHTFTYRNGIKNTGKVLTLLQYMEEL